MRSLSIAMLVAGLALAGLTYHQHGRYKELDIQRFTPNPDGTVSVQLFGPGVRNVDKAKTVRNVLGAGSGLCLVLGIGLMTASSRRKAKPSTEPDPNVDKSKPNSPPERSAELTRNVPKAQPEEARGSSGMKTERKWHVQKNDEIRREADRLGLVQESWQIVKLVPSMPPESFEDINVCGTVACHECGKPVPFTQSFTWGMLGGPTLSCPTCSVDISLGAYDAESAGIQPLWIYAAPFTEHGRPSHPNSIVITSIDGVSVGSTQEAQPAASDVSFTFLFADRVNLELAVDDVNARINESLLPLSQCTGKAAFVKENNIAPNIKLLKQRTDDGALLLHAALRAGEDDDPLGQLLRSISSHKGTLKELKTDASTAARIRAMGAELGICSADPV